MHMNSARILWIMGKTRQIPALLSVRVANVLKPGPHSATLWSSNAMYGLGGDQRSTSVSRDNIKHRDKKGGFGRLKIFKVIVRRHSARLHEQGNTKR